MTVGGGAMVRVQSMTNTDTVDVIGTAIQVKELAQAGSEFVRITVNTPEAAAAVPYIREQLDRMGKTSRWWETFTTTATSFSQIFRHVPKHCPSTGSIQVTWAKVKSRIVSLVR